MVTAASKLFEICILEILDTYLTTHDHQFGFKSEHSTDMCIFTVKSVIKYYTEQNTAIYTYVYWTLGKPLIELIIGHYLLN